MGSDLEDVTVDALGIQSIKRFVDSNDPAALSLFLASDSAKSISGQTIAIAMATPKPTSNTTRATGPAALRQLGPAPP